MPRPTKRTYTPRRAARPAKRGSSLTATKTPRRRATRQVQITANMVPGLARGGNVIGQIAREAARRAVTLNNVQSSAAFIVDHLRGNMSMLEQQRAQDAAQSRANAERADRARQVMAAVPYRRYDAMRSKMTPMRSMDARSPKSKARTSRARRAK